MVFLWNETSELARSFPTGRRIVLGTLEHALDARLGLHVLVLVIKRRIAFQALRRFPLAAATCFSGFR